VSEQSVGNWKRQFLESGRAGLVAGKSSPSTRAAQLEAQVAELTQALSEAAAELRVWKKSAEGRLALRGPRGDPHRGGHADREVLRADRRARADLVPPSGPRPGRPADAGPVAAASPRAGP
jgi:transposase